MGCYDSKAITTGGQDIAPEALDLCLAPYRASLIRVENPFDTDALEQSFRKMEDSHNLQILLVNFRE